MGVSYCIRLFVIAFIMCSLTWSCTTQAEREKGKKMVDLIKAGDFQNAEALLQEGAFVDAKDEQLGAGALIYACMNGSKQMVKALIDHDADINLQDNSGRSALHFACLTGEADIVRLLLKKGAKVNIRNKTKETPLINAVAGRRLPIVSMLLKSGAKVNIHGPNGLTPLMFAAMGNPGLEIADLLLRNGADVDAQEHNGNTALFCASGIFKTIWKSPGGAQRKIESLSDDQEIVQRLIEAGADLNIKNKAGYTPWSIAFSSGNPHIAKLLKNAGARPAGRKMDPNEAFRIALFLGGFKQASWLLKNGASVNHRNANDSTPLMSAAYKGDYAAAKWLLEKGADPHLRNRFKKTALDYAVEENNKKIEQLIRGYNNNR